MQNLLFQTSPHLLFTAFVRLLTFTLSVDLDLCTNASPLPSASILDHFDQAAYRFLEPPWRHMTQKHGLYLSLKVANEIKIETFVCAMFNSSGLSHGHSAYINKKTGPNSTSARDLYFLLLPY